MRINPLFVGLALASALLCGCTGQNMKKEKPFSISVMTSASAGNSVTDDSPVKQRVEELTNTKLDINFVPSEAYADELNVTLASGRMPMVMYVDRMTPNIISAIRRGEFWDITDYLKDYENLSNAEPELLKSSAFEGRIYGLYRKRNMGRFGYAYRKDWLEKLGLSEPETVDEFYNMLYQFTYNDPDGNGVNDTYGMTVTTSDITFKNFAVWNGAPNEWGVDQDGKLIPAHLTEEYFKTLKMFKKMSEEGLINPDFFIMDSADWNEPFVNGKSGVILDTCDRATTLYNLLKENNPSGEVGVAGVVNGKARPHLGYSGYFAFPKSSVADETALKRVLQFMDDCCAGEVFDLMRYGIEGRHYDLVDGFVSQRIGADVPRNEINDFNQVLTYMNESEGLEVVKSELQENVVNAQIKNKEHSVANPAENLFSETYAQKSNELDVIINEARIKYMSGQLMDSEYMSELQRWRDSGGDDIISEINEAYTKQ